MTKIQKNEICLIVGSSLLFFLFYTAMNILSGAAMVMTLLHVGLASLSMLLCGFISVCYVNHFYPNLILEDEPAYTPVSTVELDIVPQPTPSSISPLENKSSTSENQLSHVSENEVNDDGLANENLPSHINRM